MPLVDTKGRTWAHSTTCKAGDVLVCDGGFTCLREGAEVEVHSDPERDGVNALYVPCDDGAHYLDGQLDFDGCGAFVGLYPRVH